jgi:salicylate biosynthesis isochorismate synthase
MSDRSTTEARGTADAAAFLGEALTEPLPEGGIRLVTVPAPAADAETFLRLGTGPAVFWALPGGPAHAGLGAAHTVVASGAGRFRDIQEGAARLWERISATAHPDSAPTVPRLFGGFAFLSEGVPALWNDFGEATFVLPRLLYTADEGGARLSVAMAADELRAGAAALYDEARRVLEALDARTPAGTSGEAGPITPTDLRPESVERAEWTRAVASIQRRFEEGVGEKVVAARSRGLRLSRRPDLPDLLGRLARESATAARFAFRVGAGTFLGATPERLVGRTGSEVRTEALAGTVPAGSPQREARLLASLKDSAEHAYVVRAILEALEPLCERLEYPETPRIQRLRHVVHLQTPFVGRLREPVHILELVRRLHPTPAVGGWPTGSALDWIAREEPGSRGWYAAPVGWFDDRGDGEFGVALRSGLLHGDRAYLYAGAGIVRDSDPAAEFAETEVKLQTMLDALGLPS